MQLPCQKSRAMEKCVDVKQKKKKFEELTSIPGCA